MVDPGHFEAHAADYERARPPYPPALWSRIRELGHLRPGCRALDIGAGTGQATAPLIAAGMRVTAVEPGPRLAARLQAANPAATVVVGRAEELKLPDASFDLVVAATSIHWMDLDVVLPKIHRLLTPEGAFLVWRNVFGDPSVTTPFRRRVAEIVAARDAPPRPDAEDLAVTSAELIRSGLFVVESTDVFRWKIELDDEQVRALFSTFSDWSPEEAERAAGAVRDLGGRVEENYLTWLVALQPA